MKAPVTKAWEYYNGPGHITKWNAAAPGWHCPSASNDLRPGGSLQCRMEAKDGSFGFDFRAIYDTVKPNELIEYTLGDGRQVIVRFTPIGSETKVEITFDAETENPVEMQQAGWQAILNNFARYTEVN